MTFDANKTISARIRRRVIKDWRSRLRDYSTISLAFSTAVAAAWSALPADWVAALPVAWVARAIGVITALGLAGKFLTQEPPKDGQ